jgi:hypothetical protein
MPRPSEWRRGKLLSRTHTNVCLCQLAGSSWDLYLRVGHVLLACGNAPTRKGSRRGHRERPDCIWGR